VIVVDGPVLLYDGDCGFCAESVQIVLRHERRGRVRFAPLQGAFAAAVRARHPELHAVDSMVWVEPIEPGIDRAFVRSTAALRLAGYLGGIWRVLLLGYLLPTAVRDGLYNFIARHRHQIPGAGTACVVVPPNLRHRFLD
jgi:predicted DCC family thiol-disulfide oxidoreductase YuxK